jgi:hypothetical protein
MGDSGTGLDPATLRSLGGAYARALIQAVARRGETVPVEHAFAIVLAAAAKLEAANAAGRRASALPEAVLVRHDGTVELGVARTPPGAARDDVATLCRLLVELLGSADLPGELAATIASLIAPDRHASVKELARSLAQTAKSESMSLSKHAVGRWVRSVMVPHYRPTPPVGVGTPSDGSRALANGSGSFAGDERFAEIPTGVKEIIEKSAPVRTTLLAADPPPAPADQPAPRPSRARPLAFALALVAVAAAAYTFGPDIQRLARRADAPAAAPAAVPAAPPAAVRLELASVPPAPPPEDSFDAISGADPAAEPVAADPAPAVAPAAPAQADKSKRRHGKKRGAKRRGR